MRAIVAQNIDRAIVAKSLTNRQVADAIGTTEHQVWRWRRGHVRPVDRTLSALADALGQNIAWFFIDHNREPDEAVA